MDEVEAVKAAIANTTGMASRYSDSDLRDIALAAIAALDEARGDPVAKVVAWLRAGAGQNTQSLDRTTKALFLRGLNSYADAIERGEPFNG